MGRALLLTVVLAAACGGGADATTNGDGGLDGTTSADAGACFDDGPGCEPWCPPSWPDAGFTSLKDFPVAKLCAGIDVNGVYELKVECQGYVIVTISVGVDGSGWWLFDGATGEFVAYGSGGPDTPGIGCQGAVPGLKVPYQCFLYGGWYGRTDLCPEGGTGRDVGDAAD